jgi:hypothetical protein
MVTNAYNPSTQEAEAERQEFKASLGYNSKFNSNLAYIVRTCLNNKEYGYNIYIILMK